jgi:hypothetical protein
MTDGGRVSLGGGFTAVGAVRLMFADIKGQLLCHGAELADSVDLRGKLAAGRQGPALNAAGAQITGILRWAPAERVSGQANPEGAFAGVLEDDWTLERATANGYWPGGARLHIDCFTYARLGGDPPTSMPRLADGSDSPGMPDMLLVSTRAIAGAR